MIEGSYHLRRLVEANTKYVQLASLWTHRIEPHFEHRGLLRNAVARLGCTMVRLGTSLERLAQLDEQVPVDICDARGVDVPLMGFERR